MVHVPNEFDKERKLDISKIFPAHTTVIKLQGLILGGPTNLNDVSLQAVLFSQPLRDDIHISFLIIKEYDNGSFKQFHVNNKKLEDVENGDDINKLLVTDAAFNVVFEVTNEMKTNVSALSNSKVSCVTEQTM